MFMRLLSYGSPLDMHVFCKEHVSLLRLALVEYYIHFVSANLPVEARLQHRLFGVDVDVHSVFRQIQVIVDNFRQMLFQSEDFTWDCVVARAQIAVEKCNRSCKGAKHELAKTALAAAFVSDLGRIKAMPAFTHPIYLNEPLHAALRALAVRRLIRTHTMPFNIAFEQAKRLRQAMQIDTNQAINESFLYVCLTCAHSIPDKSMRIGSEGHVVCSSCHDTKSIVCINMTGRIVSGTEEQEIIPVSLLLAGARVEHQRL